MSVSSDKRKKRIKKNGTKIKRNSITIKECCTIQFNKSIEVENTLNEGLLKRTFCQLKIIIK